MKRTLLLTAALLTAAIVALPGQQATNDANPLYRPTSIRMSTISVPPITGAPFSATALIKNQQILPDGSVATSRNVNLIGRDSRGRTHGEMRSRVPESSREMPPLSEVHIYDPQTRVGTIWYPATHIAVRRKQPGTPTTANVAYTPNPLVKVEDLGTTTIDHIDAKGTRRTVIIPAEANNTGAPIAVVDEYWYSEDLHVNLLLLHNDPRTGLQTVALTDIKREEPPQPFFEVPADYKIVDLTPPQGAPVQPARMAPGSSNP
jgi:hypothetical protein